MQQEREKLLNKNWKNLVKEKNFTQEQKVLEYYQKK